MAEVRGADRREVLALQPLGHGIEGLAEQADFVAPADIGSRLEVAGTHGVRSGDKLRYGSRDRTRDQPSDEEHTRRRDGEEHCKLRLCGRLRAEHERQRQCDGIETRLLPTNF